MAKPKGTGLHKIDIDWDEFEKLCEIQCSAEEIAFWFRCSVDTIQNRVKEHYKDTFSAVMPQKAVRGKIAIRRGLFKLGLQGNLGALIWLSKQHLDFSEKMQTKTDPGDKSKDTAIERLSAQLASLKALANNDPIGLE